MELSIGPMTVADLSAVLADHAGSVAFHQRLGFTTREVPGYNGAGHPMVVMTGPLPLGLPAELD